MESCTLAVHVVKLKCIVGRGVDSEPRLMQSKFTSQIITVRPY